MNKYKIQTVKHMRNMNINKPDSYVIEFLFIYYVEIEFGISHLVLTFIVVRKRLADRVYKRIQMVHKCS